MARAERVDPSLPTALVAAASAATVAGCEPIVHGYRTGLVTSVLVIGIVLAFVAVLIARVGRHSMHPPRRPPAGPRRRPRHHRA